MEIEYLNIS